MNDLYEQWIELKRKNEDYATSLRVVLPKLDELIIHHGLDKKRTEKYDELKQKFSEAMGKLKDDLQKLCEQPVSPMKVIRHESLEPTLNAVHESYSALYRLSSEQQEATKQQYLTVLDFENYLALLDHAYPNDILENGDSLVSALAIVAKQPDIFTALPQYSHQLAIEAVKRLAEERGWPQQLYAAKVVLAALNDQFSSASAGDITSPWGELAWQNIHKGLEKRFIAVLNTDQLKGFAEKVSNLLEWETKLIDLRQSLKWSDYSGNLENWRTFIVEGSSESQPPLTEEVDSISQALQEAIEARIEIADKSTTVKEVAFYGAQALLAQRVIRQFEEQLPQTIEKLRDAASDLQNTSVPQFKRILETVSKAYDQIDTIPKVIVKANILSETINAGATALSELKTAWDDYKINQTNIAQQTELDKQNWLGIEANIKNQISKYALVSQARDSALGLLGASASVTELTDAAQIELASLYIALGLQAVRNFNKDNAQQYWENSQNIIEGMSQADNQHAYSLLKKLQDGVKWLQECKEGNIEKLTEWRDAVYAEDSKKAKQAWAQLEELPNAKSLLLGWVVTELAERQMGLSRTIVIGHGDSSAETENVFNLFLQLFELIESKSDAKGFTLYERLVEPFSQNTPNHGARFTLDNQAIFLNASSDALQTKARIAEKLKNYRLTYNQGEYLRTWLLWHKQHEQTRQIIKMARENLVSATLKDFVSNKQINAKINQLIDHIKNVSLLKKQGSDLPLTQDTTNELKQAVDQIVGKFTAVPDEAKNVQGELKRRLLACKGFLIKLQEDNSHFPQRSAQTYGRPSSDSPVTDLSSENYPVKGKLETPQIQPHSAEQALKPGTPPASESPPSKTSGLKKIWQRLFPENRNKRGG